MTDKKKIMGIYIDRDLCDRMIILATYRNVIGKSKPRSSVSMIINEAVSEYLKNHEDENEQYRRMIGRYSI